MAVTSQDKREIEKIVKKELNTFLKTTNAHRIVLKMIQDEIGSKKTNEKIVALATKVVVELFKTLWQRKSFWEGALKNVK
jgi:hypothetical protein